MKKFLRENSLSLVFVLLTVSLYQKGSSGCKSLDEPEEVDREPSSARKGAPWPVRRGGWVLKLYQNSLSIAYFLLFGLSFYLHAIGVSGSIIRNRHWKEKRRC